MASVADDRSSFFLASLDKCLSGAHSLISWETAYDAFADIRLAQNSSNLKSFLLDELSLAQLSREFDPILSATSQSKTDFEARTTAINITINNDASRNVGEIREDALWLSQEAKIDEVTALRIAILEWQGRPTARILHGYTNEENVGLQRAVKGPPVSASSFLQGCTNNGVKFDDAAFLSKESRHTRLLHILLSERENVLAIAFLLAATSLDDPTETHDRSLNATTKAPLDQIPWLGDVARAVEQVRALKKGDLIKPTTPAVEALEKRLANVERGSAWATVTEATFELEIAFRNSQIIEMICILETLFVRISLAGHLVSPDAVRSWFIFVEKFQFFEHSQLPYRDGQLGRFQALICLVSVHTLKLPYVIDSLRATSHGDETEVPVLKQDWRESITELLFSEKAAPSPIASLARFAWSVILQKVDMISDPTKQLSQNNAWISPKVTRDEDFQKDGSDSNSLALRFARFAVDESGAFRVIGEVASMLPCLFDLPWAWRPQLHARVALLDLLREGLQYANYSEDLIQACLAILRCDITEPSSEGYGLAISEILNRIVEIFCCDERLYKGFVERAERRYPCELAPFLRLCQAMTSASESSFKQSSLNLPFAEVTETFTQTMPADFNGFDLPEDYDSNIIRLTQNLPLFVSTNKNLMLMNNARSQQIVVVQDRHLPEMAVPRGTTGRIISDSKPSIVIWSHRHSTVKFVSLLLSTTTSYSPRRQFTNNGSLDREAQADSINFMAALCSRAPEFALQVLEEASDVLERNEDIITVVADIFEANLSSRICRDESQIDLLSSCLRFLSSVLRCAPNRIWPVLARSCLLGMDGRGSRMTMFALASEEGPGRQAFAHECVCLLEALIADVLLHALLRNNQNASHKNRFDRASSTSTGISPKIVETIMFALVEQSVALFQGSILESQQLILETLTKAVRIFNHIVECVYGFDDTKKPSDKLTAILTRSADFILHEFLTSSESVLAMSLLATGTSLRKPSGAPIRSSISLSSRAHIQAILTFLTTLLRVRPLLDTPFSLLEQQLSDILPFVIRLYASEETHKNHILILISALMTNAAAAAHGGPASLLGHMAPETGQSFLCLLRDSNHALNDTDLETNTWNLLTTAINSKQQAFATFVITGNMPKDSLKKKTTTSSPNTTAQKSFFAMALDAVSEKSAFSKTIIPPMLKLIGAVQSYWPWTTNTIQKHPRFLAQAADYLENVGENISTNDSGQTQVVFVTSLLVDILSVYLHNMRKLGDVSFLKILGPKLTYLREYSVGVPCYNSSLHANLKKNVERKYPGCNLSNFKRLINRSSFGDNYFYDIAFAGDILGFDPVWRNGFVKEFRRANVNLSLVEAQIRLMSSWRSLAMELSMSVSEEKGVQTAMARTALECLKAIVNSKASEPFLEDLLESRAEFAFAISQRLVKVQVSTQDMRNVLPATWNAIIVSDPNFETMLVGPRASYFRTLLSTLLLALQSHASAHDMPMEIESAKTLASTRSSSSQSLGQDNQLDISSILREIITKVIGQCFRGVAAELNTNPTNVEPSDLALLTSILQGVLHARPIRLNDTNIVLHLCELGVHRDALALFSWSNKLLGLHNDPIIGDLTISFLRELSTVPRMAEYLATESILNQLNTTPLVNYIRQQTSGFGPFDQPFRLHTIWAHGIIPLSLNVLLAVGDAFTAEATAFLNNFPHQLTRITTAFGTKAAGTGNITLDDAIEVHNLALTVFTLERYRGLAGARAINGGDIPDLKANWAGLKEDLEGWFNGRSSKGRIVPRSEREALLSRAKPEGEVPDASNRLDEMVLVELRGALECLGGSY